MKNHSLIVKNHFYVEIQINSELHIICINVFKDTSIEEGDSLSIPVNLIKIEEGDFFISNLRKIEKYAFNWCYFKSLFLPQDLVNFSLNDFPTDLQIIEIAENLNINIGIDKRLFNIIC